MNKTIAVVCGTVVALAFIGGLVVLAYAGKDSTSLSGLLSTLLSAAGALSGTGALVYAKTAAKQTNGDHFEDRMMRVLDKRKGDGPVA